MILESEVTIRPSQKTLPHYEAQGYCIPKVLNSRKRLNYKRDFEFSVKVSDLHPKSRARISCKCNKCGEVRIASFRDYKPLCKNCFRKTGNENPQWQGGIQGLIERLPKCLECDKKLSATKYELCKSCAQLGSKNPVWNPNLTESERRRNARGRSGRIGVWKKKVKKAFNHTCVICMSKANIECHHLNAFNKFPEQRYRLDNGVALCYSCHKLFHKKYGRGNNTKEQFFMFLEEGKRQCNTPS